MTDITPRWYCVSREGMATLCVDEADAKETAAEADLDWPRNAPHRAVLLGDVAAMRAEIERLRTEAAKSERRAIVFGDMLSQNICAMRAAVVAAYNGTPADGMRWIENTLCGPGQLPNKQDAALGAQALFDKELAELEEFRKAHPAP